MRACIQIKSDQDEKKKGILPFRNAKRIGAQTPLPLSFVFGCLFHPSIHPSIHTPAYLTSLNAPPLPFLILSLFPPLSASFHWIYGK